MNVIQAHDAVRKFYQVQVVGGNPSVAFDTQRDNEPLIDSSGARIDRTQKPWATMSFRITESNQVQVGSLGANTHRHIGLVIMQVFTPVDKGDSDTWSIAKFIADKFRSAIVTGTGGSVRFSTPTFRVVGRSDSWWQINVICPYHFDEIG